ncbi:MAG: hypothetical protein ACTH3E_12005 [Psychroflexus halocasei]
MKNNLILLLTFLPLTILGQQLKCCETEKDVEQYLIGEWKNKNSNSNVEYHYWKENGKIYLSIVEPTELKNEYLLVEHDFNVRVEKTNLGFKIQTINLNADLNAELKYLNSNKLILITDGKETEYYRITE